MKKYKKTFIKTKILFSLIFMFVLISCNSKVDNNDPKQVAEAFVKNYYKFFNQEEAVKYTDMMAKDKMKKELELVREARAKNPQALEQNRAKVGYKLEEANIEKDMGFITFTLSIVPNGSTSFDRNALITVQKEKDGWKVVDYQESNTGK